ncbi:crotonase/enoyl-CoA hydratase family protein [Streptomyces sp. cg40]|uniref:crotonase/enoyl-CoA hydratase family protein n=1 Tax=Streptomyces sp. cg40 TaxID=3419764 RepID=UPI003CFFE59F
MTSWADPALEQQLLSLRVDRQEHIAEVTLLGPGRGNAMGPDFWRELPLVFRELDSDPEVRAVVLTGSGDNFSYGLDLPAMMGAWEEMLAPGATAEPRTRLLRVIRELQAAVSAVADCRTPVVAAVHGWCVGGGVDLIAAADVRVASTDARFSVREVRVAVVADLGSLQRLAGIVGEGHLRELALTGGDIDAARAERIGLVNDVHPDGAAALDAARALARRIADNPPLVVRGVKEVLDLDRGPRVEAGLRHVSTWNAAFLSSDDLAEAVRAFGERRAPRFTGR